MLFSFIIKSDKGKPLPGAAVSFIGADGATVHKVVANARGVAVVDAVWGAGIFYPSNVIRFEADGFYKSEIPADDAAIETEIWLNPKINRWLYGLKVAAAVAAFLLITGTDPNKGKR